MFLFLHSEPVFNTEVDLISTRQATSASGVQIVGTISFHFRCFFIFLTQSSTVLYFNSEQSPYSIQSQGKPEQNVPLCAALHISTGLKPSKDFLLNALQKRSNLK